MPDDFEHSDILGSSSPVGPGRLPRQSTLLSWSSLAILGAAAVFTFFLLQRGRAFYVQWLDRRRRLAVRRRHGIPDTDHRPFNVAYAAVQLAQDDKKRASPLSATFPTAAAKHEDSVVQDGLRHRPSNGLPANLSFPDPGLSAPDPPRRANSSQPNMIASSSSGHIRSPTAYVEEPRRDRSETFNPTFPGAIRGLSSPDLSRHTRPDPLPLQFPAESHTQSSESPELPTADVQEEPGSIVDETPAARRSKRGAESSGDERDENETPFHGRRHDKNKRRRKVSGRGMAPPADEDMDVDDDVPELPSVSTRRGKKRDRAEAGSTMGDEDAMEVEGAAQHRRRRRRHRKSSLGGVKRGQKRDRDSDETSDDAADGNRVSGRASRRRHDDGPGAEDSDVAMSDTRSVRSNVTVRGRRIGEEWEAHGYRYKIGPDGQRLTQTLVREDRPLYNMPQDSSHPDREAVVEVVRELWLTDPELKEAKDRQMLAWQSPMKSSTPSTPRASRLALPSSTLGKELLWNSTPGSPTQRIEFPREKFGGSPTATPFRTRTGSTPSGTPPPPLLTSSSRRISLLSATSSRATDVSPVKKGFTRWQKQEIEAEAIEAARKRREEKARAEEEETRRESEIVAAEARRKADEEEAAKKRAAAAAMPPPPIPAPASASNASFPPKKEEAPAGATAAPKTFAFAPSTPSPLATAPPKEGNKPAPTFAFPSSTPAAPPSSNASSTSAPHTSSSIPNFFAKPAASTPGPASAPPASTSAPAPANSGGTTPNFFANAGRPAAQTSNSMPNFFANSGTSAPTTLAAPAPSAAAPPAAAKDDKPSFSFPKPASSAPTPSLFAPTPSAPAPPVPSAPGASDASKPKFNFAAPSRPPLVPTAGAAAASELAKPVSEPAKAAPTPFSFKFGDTAKKDAPAAGAGGGEAAKSAFGDTSKNAFTKSAFSVASEGTKSVFGVGGAEGTKSIFGAGGDAGKSVFGTPGANTGAGDAPKPTFGASVGTVDGSKAAAPTFGSSGANGAFGAFGGGASAFAPAAASGSGSGPKTTFAFGASSTPAAANAAFGSPSAFGPGATGAAPVFGSNANTNATTTTTPGSGAGPSQAGGAAEGSKPSGFTFNFGKGPAAGAPAPVFGSTTGAGGGGANAFGFGNAEKKVE